MPLDIAVFGLGDFTKGAQQVQSVMVFNGKQQPEPDPLKEQLNLCRFPVHKQPDITIGGRHTASQRCHERRIPPGPAAD
jgi:hypothetical protein